MKNKISIFIKGIFAGLCISLGGYIFIKTSVVSSNNIIPSFLFPIGLMIICTFGFYLYTGKICYVFEDNVVSDTKNIGNKILSLFIGLVGNMVGCFIFSLIVRLCETNDSFYELLKSMVDKKDGYVWYRTILSSIVCGFLVNMAVFGFKRCNSEFGKYLLVLICIGAFVVCGFDHCVANMFYYFTNIQMTLTTWLNLLLCILGNTVGGLIFPLFEKFIK